MKPLTKYFLVVSIIAFIAAGSAEPDLEARVKQLEEQMTKAGEDIERQTAAYNDLKKTNEEQKQAIAKTQAELSQKLVDAQNQLTQKQKDFEGIYSLAKVPVGTILSYQGTLLGLPKNWRVCDGSLVSNEPNSPFNNKSLPDLEGKFLRGVEASGLIITTQVGEEGGQDYIEEHTHPVSGYASNVYFGTNSLSGWIKGGYHPVTGTYMNDDEHLNYDQTVWTLPFNNNNESHGHSGGSGSVSGTAKGNGSHDNRPKFYSVYYIIRIR